MTLLEKYEKRISVAEAVHAKATDGRKLSNSKKIAIATVLDNTNRFLNESFANSNGTQRADLGAWKRFCLNLTTVAVPNLIAHELVIVYPMTSLSGYITYLKYTSGSDKGAVAKGDVFNDPFRLGEAANKNFTGATVSEAHEVTSDEATAKKFAVKWTPVADVKGVKVGEKTYEIVAKDPVADTSVTFTPTGEIVFNSTDTLVVEGAVVDVLYHYDNVVIPQNDLPVLNAEMASLPLIAKARRIAVYYSQIAAFQAKTDYGFDLGDQLAEKAVGQLSYEIDTEVTDLLIENAKVDGDLKFNRTLPLGVNKADHYEGFSEVVEIAKQKIYDATKRFAPNYMLIASNVLPLLTFIKGFKAAPGGTINGPYFAGTLGSLKVFVTPNIDPGKFVCGVNGDDMMSSAAVYAPYMTIVPTQLLGYADGTMTQGFSSMYALEMLNPGLLIAGTVVTEPLDPVITEEEA